MSVGRKKLNYYLKNGLLPWRKKEKENCCESNIIKRLKTLKKKKKKYQKLFGFSSVSCVPPAQLLQTNKGRIEGGEKNFHCFIIYIVFPHLLPPRSFRSHLFHQAASVTPHDSLYKSHPLLHRSSWPLVWARPPVPRPAPQLRVLKLTAFLNTDAIRKSVLKWLSEASTRWFISVCPLPASHPEAACPRARRVQNVSA